MDSTPQDPIDPVLKTEVGKGMDREQWARLKDTIHHLYIDQNLNCKQVAAILREQHDDRVRERTLQRHMKEWGFVKGSHLEFLPGSIPWQSQELADLITQKFWESKTDSQMWKDLHSQGHTSISYFRKLGSAYDRQRQIRSIRSRHGLLRTSKLDAQGILDYLATEQPPWEQLPSIRRLVKFFREERRIWVTRDVCNEALNMAKVKNREVLESLQNEGVSNDQAVQSVLVLESNGL